MIRPPQAVFDQKSSGQIGLGNLELNQYSKGIKKFQKKLYVIK